MNNNQAALDLFSNYSDFLLTDDELLAIHGGGTPGHGQAGSTNTGGSTPSAPSAPPPTPPPAPVTPPTPAAPPNLSPVSVTTTVTLDLTPVVTETARDVRNSDAAESFDTLVTHAIEAVDNFFFGPSHPAPPPDAGGAGGAHGAGGTGG